MRRRVTPLLLLSIMLLACTATGCGQKGPLYHPDATPPAKNEPAPVPATRAPDGSAAAAIR